VLGGGVAGLAGHRVQAHAVTPAERTPPEHPATGSGSARFERRHEELPDLAPEPVQHLRAVVVLPDVGEFEFGDPLAQQPDVDVSGPNLWSVFAGSHKKLTADTEICQATRPATRATMT